ncbi:MAG TPA: hypothetical protein VHD69_02700 [Candidatus Paceibacterota bacterium]|jgi:hypothetical protein|nr:hypothetical protein [Candidatus Paceibacterota bacterium]
MIELTTSLLMLATAFTSVGASAQTDRGTDATAGATTTAAIERPLSTLSTEAYVRDYFKDTPILAEVARCESTFRQFGSDGNVIRGKVNKNDVGVMQINTYYHEDTAESLGLDIYTIDGNLAYGKHLYEKFGLDPWKSSSKCWKKHLDIAQS